MRNRTSVIFGLAIVLSLLPRIAFAEDRIEISGNNYQLIPEIMALENGATVPAEVYSKYDSRLIAASLVKRYHLKAETPGNQNKPDFDYMSDGEVQLSFDPEDIGHIANFGFQNQHQTNVSKGTLNPKGRQMLEDEQVRVKLESSYVQGQENPVNLVRPKYSYLTFNKNPDGLHHVSMRQGTIDQGWYGNTIAVLNKNIRLRSTFTPSDSLEIAKDLGKEALDSLIHSFFFLSSQKIVLPESDYKEIIENSYGYWEAQIWGSLTLADVDYFLVNCPGTQTITNSHLDKLKLVGLPIFNCTLPEDNSHNQPTEMLSAGNKSYVKQWVAPLQGTDNNKLLVK